VNENRLSVAPRPGPAQPEAPAGVRTIPFDYVLTFDLKNENGRVISRVLNISPVGTFSVTAIGYGLMIDERVIRRRFGPVDPELSFERPLSVPVPGVVLPGTRSAPVPVELLDAEVIDAEEADESDADEADTSHAVKVLGAPRATVRASLNGRPIVGADGTDTIVLGEEGRAFLDPSTFALTGQGTLVVEDVTHGVTSRPIYVVGGARLLSSAPHFGLTLPQSGGRGFDVIGVPGSMAEIRIDRPGADRVPRFFGQVELPVEGTEPGVARVHITDLRNGRKVQGAPPQERAELDAEQMAFRLRAGDVVTVSPSEEPESPPFAPAGVTIGGAGALTLSSLPVSALRDGFRLDRRLLDRLVNGVDPPAEDLEQPFVPCGVDASDLSFLYSIQDNGTGRAYQNEPVHNIAGLGIANGERPFRRLAHPIVFEPRSVILFQIHEISGGPGTLYVVLQGYKTVGAGRPRFGF